MPSNQGRDIDKVLDTCSVDDLEDVARVIWREIRPHPPTATCFCPAVEAVARLQELGYTITKETNGQAAPGST